MIGLFFKIIEKLTHAYHAWLWNPFGVTVGITIFGFSAINVVSRIVFDSVGVVDFTFLCIFALISMHTHISQIKDLKLYTALVISTMHQPTIASMANIFFIFLLGWMVVFDLAFGYYLNAFNGIMGQLWLAMHFVPVAERQPPERQWRVANNEV